MEVNDIYYLAGLLEGEGSFVIAKPHGKIPNIRITMNSIDKDSIDRVLRLSKIGSVRGPMNKQTGRVQWTWQVAKQQDAAALMMTLYTLMGQRRQEQIRKCLLIWRTTKHRIRRELTFQDYAEIKRLYFKTHLTQKQIANQFGVSDSHICKIINGDY